MLANIRNNFHRRQAFLHPAPPPGPVHEKHDELFNDAVQCVLDNEFASAKRKCRKLITVNAFNASEAQRLLQRIEKKELALEQARLNELGLDAALSKTPTELFDKAYELELDGNVKAAQTMYRQLIMLGALNKDRALQRLQIMDETEVASQRAYVEAQLPAEDAQTINIRSKIYTELFKEARVYEEKGDSIKAETWYRLLIQVGAFNQDDAQCRLDIIEEIRLKAASMHFNLHFSDIDTLTTDEEYKELFDGIKAINAINAHYKELFNLAEQYELRGWIEAAQAKYQEIITADAFNRDLAEQRLNKIQNER